MLCVVLLLLGVVQANIRDCNGVTAKNLAGKLFTIRSGVYDYTIKVGNNGYITQKRWTGHAGQWRLGYHTGYANNDMMEKFGNGERCHNGPRSAEITYRFGNGHRILSANEPRTCFYQFTVQIDQNICKTVKPPTPRPTRPPTPQPTRPPTPAPTKPPTPAPTKPPTPAPTTLCDAVKANKGVQGQARIWDDIDVRVKRGQKSREKKLKSGGNADPLCECISYCEDSDIFVYSTKQKKAQIFGRCKCWDLPNNVKNGTIRPKAKNKKRSESYQVGAISDKAKSAIENGIAKKSKKGGKIKG